jgi:hypothetical protein
MTLPTQVEDEIYERMRYELLDRIAMGRISVSLGNERAATRLAAVEKILTDLLEARTKQAMEKPA